MRAQCFASKALLLAIAALLIAVGPAAAGSYSPKHLRAEGFLKLQTLNDLREFVPQVQLVQVVS